MITVRIEDLIQEQQQDILNGLYTLTELNEYIAHMISSIKHSKPDND